MALWEPNVEELRVSWALCATYGADDSSLLLDSRLGSRVFGLKELDGFPFCLQLFIFLAGKGW